MLDNKRCRHRQIPLSHLGFKRMHTRQKNNDPWTRTHTRQETKPCIKSDAIIR